MFTAESVTPFHPDKICDRIADALLDLALKDNPRHRCAFEVQGGHNLITITGETSYQLTLEDAVAVVDSIGGCSGSLVRLNLSPQSPEIAQGVDVGGAGDQGVMIGFACRESPDMMPIEHYLARSLMMRIFRQHSVDGKTQVSIRFLNPRAVEITGIVASFQNVTQAELRVLITDWINQLDDEIKGAPQRATVAHHKLEITVADGAHIYANPAGDWKVGGFDSDAGTVGRKIVVDAYGPRVPVGGGAFSGKDPTKVDRSAAYAARQAALELLSQQPDAESVEVTIAYAIGKDIPLQASAVVMFEDRHRSLVVELDKNALTPSVIIDRLKLREQEYERVASFGSFGFYRHPWEQVNESDAERYSEINQPADASN